MNKFNAWILEKVAAFLTAKEGCSVLSTKNASDYSSMRVKDAFGFVYEVEVKLIGHTQNFQPSFNMTTEFIEKLK